MLEKGRIPPNAVFEKMSPEIDADFYHIKVPTESIPWPTEGLRRISINSFGFGGTNAHAILDDAFSYLRDHGLEGNHRTSPSSLAPAMTNDNSAEICNRTSNASQPPTAVTRSHDLGNPKQLHKANGTEPCTNGKVPCLNGTNTIDTARGTCKEPACIVGNGHANGTPAPEPSLRLLVWTAADESALRSTIETYQTYWRDDVFKVGGAKVDQLAYTLAARRSTLLWRTFSVVGGDSELRAAKSTRASTDITLLFVFTGQGAQYEKMGLELTKYPVFEATLRKIDGIFQSLGCTWSIFGEYLQRFAVPFRRYSHLEDMEY